MDVRPRKQSSLDVERRKTYCRDRDRELRESKVKEERIASNPKEEFERLLKEEVKSTRTSWTDWRRQWKKDRRFYGWGKDDREREKKFRDYLKELSESRFISLTGFHHIQLSFQKSERLHKRLNQTSSPY